MEIDLAKVVEKLTQRVASTTLELAQYQALTEQLVEENATLKSSLLSITKDN